MLEWSKSGSNDPCGHISATEEKLAVNIISLKINSANHPKSEML